MAPRPGGGLYVVVVSDRRSILALLDGAGRPHQGWPVELAGWSCGGTWASWRPLAAPDGSVRVVCSRFAYGEHETVRAFAFDAAGRPLAGWPVDLPGPVWGSRPRLVADRLLVVQRGWRLLGVAADGTLQEGAWVEDVSTREGDACRYCSGGDPQIGPDGIAYQLNYLSSTYEIAAFDLDGMRPGWPVPIAASSLGLSAGPDGRVYVTTPSVCPDALSGQATDLIVFDAGGDRLGAAIAELPIVGTGRWCGAGPGESSTLVASDGTAFVFADRGTASTVYAVDRVGRILPGWPYRATSGLQWQGSCDDERVTGCGTWLAESALGPGNVLYVPLAARNPAAGGSVTAIGSDGRALAGWPVALARPGAAIWSVVAGGDGLAYALAMEPEAGGGSSSTILAISAEGKVRYRATMVDSTLAPPTIAAVTAGENHTCALTEGGGVLCWGRNNAGQLGDGTTLDSRVPVAVAGLSSRVTAVSAGSFHTCALLDRGDVRCWGSNDKGQLGNGVTVESAVPVAVVGLPVPATALSAGGVHTCAVTVSGAALCWGFNGYGQLGDGTRYDSRLPVTVAGLSAGVRAVAAGSVHTCAILLRGDAMCWGAVQRLGNGTTGGSNRAVRVVDLSGAIAIAAGSDHTCAITRAGGLRCWGLNGSAELGTGNAGRLLAPVTPVGLEQGVRGVEAGPQDTCAVVASHELLCWGANRYGRLGDGTATFRNTPTQVLELPDTVLSVAAGGWHTCALLVDRRVACWGHGNDGELGSGRTANSATPVLVDFDG